MRGYNDFLERRLRRSGACKAKQRDEYQKGALWNYTNVTVHTARRHFDDDIGRASALLVQASKLHNGGATRLATDIRSASVAMAVGAMDAYLCDKYVDCLTSVLREYRTGSWPGNLPRFYAKQQLPAGEVLDTSRAARPNWAIRMAARSVMEKDNMLSISRVKDHFNPILPWPEDMGQLPAEASESKSPGPDRSPDSDPDRGASWG